MKTLYLPGVGFPASLRNIHNLYLSDGIEQSLMYRTGGESWIQVDYVRIINGSSLIGKTKHETSIPVTDPVLLAFYAPTGD